MTSSDFRSLWDELAPIGRDPRAGGYARYAWTAADADLRAWFTATARARDLDVETDRNGNLWAWWGRPGPDAIVTGSHLDSVPSGGAYDGPLGVVSAFLALDELRRRGVGRGADGGAAGGGTAGREPPRPVGIVCFVEEEGARFGVSCMGSRLLTGAIDADAARRLTDAEGVTLAEALTDAGVEPAGLGRDEATLSRIGIFVELHVEQGRALADLGAPVGVGTSIWPHGRYRFDFRGRADHAGTTRMEDRQDPMLTYAMTALAANKQARLAGQRATFGRVEADPNGTNAIPARVSGWLDARCSSEEALADLVAAVEKQARARAERDGTTLSVTAESVTPAVAFPADLAARVATGHAGGDWPLIPTQAGHDAGILAAAGVPAAMLFVRNPSGVSHSPEEYAEEADCLAGVRALADTLERLLPG